MNLVKKNIHMDYVKNKATNQITLEEDFNLPDTKPDMEKILFEEGEVKIEEVKAAADHVNIRGKLFISLLYLSPEEKELLARVDKEIPFDENIFVEGVESGDNIDCGYEVEDFNLSMINSRKASMRSLVTFQISCKSLYDEEAAVELYCDEPVEYRKKPLNIAEIAVCKKDIYRLHKEIEFPSGFPNIYQIIWDSIRIGAVDFKVMEGKIRVEGEVLAFFLFEGEGEERPIRFYETTIPFHGEVECNDCREDMISDISCRLVQKEYEVKPDFDGEERVVLLEAVLDLQIKLYREEKIEILADVYGVTKEVTALTQPGNFKSLLVKNDGKCRIAEKMKLQSGAQKILQVMHSEAEAILDETRMLEDSLEVTGTLMMKCLYVTGDDQMPYSSFNGMLPFTYVMDTKGIQNDCTWNVQVSLEQLNISMIDSENLEIKAIVNVSGMVFNCFSQEMIGDIQVKELDREKLKNLPGMAIYIVKKGDSLWQIGKQYYVPVKKIKDLNGLSTDECREGDKLLIVKATL